MFGTRAASRQDLALQSIVAVVLASACAATWRVMELHFVIIQAVRVRAPGKEFIAADLNGTMERMAASWQAAVLTFFFVVGFATSQNARTVGMWPQTASGSVRVATWSALAFAAVATAAASIIAGSMPSLLVSDVASVGPVPACLAATLSLQCVSAWLVAHAVNRGWHLRKSKTDALDVFGCATLALSLLILASVVSYGYLMIPGPAAIPRPAAIQGSDLSAVPFYWVTGLIGLPDWVCLAFPLAVGVLSVVGSAWLVVREPLHPGMIGGYLSRLRKA